MTPNEEYVLGILVGRFGGDLEECEIAPDGYINIDGKKNAVEVSRFVEPMIGEDGARYPRLKDDAPADKLGKEVEVDIGKSIPDGVHVFLTMSAPIKNFCSTKKLIGQAIVEIVEADEGSADCTFSGNHVSINVFREWKGKGNKIGSSIGRRYSTTNVDGKARDVLRERIKTKELIRKGYANISISEYWLALYNDFWVADVDTYRAAFREMEIPHGFDQIFIVDCYGQAHSLW